MNRIERARALLRTAGLDALLLRNGNNRFYMTGFRSSAGTVIITADKAYFFTDSRYIEAAGKTIYGYDLLLLDNDHKELDRIKETVEECSIIKLGIEESMSHSDFLSLDENLPAELSGAEGIVKSLRAGKDENEKNAILSAQAITERVFTEVLGLIRPGVTEREIAAEIVYRQLKYGAEAMSFDPIVVAGENSSMPHGKPGDNVIRDGDFITMDFGCVKNGYCSDMTRTIGVGKITEEMRRVYDTVLRAQLAGIECAKPGIEGRVIDSAGRKVIEDAGYGEFFGHGFGHGIGVEVHEAPSASPSGESIMQEGAVISAEPGIYLPGRFGVRIEDMLFLTGDGNENLTSSPKELIIL